MEARRKWVITMKNSNRKARPSEPPSAANKKRADSAVVPTVQSLVIEKTKKTTISAIRERITPALRTKMEKLIAAAPAEEPRIGMPVSTFCGEAVVVACFVDNHKAPTQDLPASFAAHIDRIGGDVAPELLFLADEARLAEDKLAQEQGEDSRELQARGRRALVEIRSACEVVVDDGVRDEKDTLVEGLRKKHDSHPKTVTALANALASYVGAARSLATELRDLADFDVRIIDDAQEMVDSLLDRVGGQTNDALRTVRTRRNRILLLIADRKRRVRKVARFVFRYYPAVLQEVASAFNRSRRADRRGEPTEDPIDDLDGPTDDETPAPTPEPSDDPT